MSLHGATKIRANYFVFPHCCLSVDFLPFESQGGCCCRTIIYLHSKTRKSKRKDEWPAFSVAPSNRSLSVSPWLESWYPTTVSHRNLRVIVLWFCRHSLEFNGVNQEGQEKTIKRCQQCLLLCGRHLMQLPAHSKHPHRACISLEQKQFVIF